MTFLRSLLRRHFAGKPGGGLAKCRLFSQPKYVSVVRSNSLIFFFTLLQMMAFDGKAEAAQFCFEKAAVRC